MVDGCVVEVDDVCGEAEIVEGQVAGSGHATGEVCYRFECPINHVVVGLQGEIAI